MSPLKGEVVSGSLGRIGPAEASGTQQKDSEDELQQSLG